MATSSIFETIRVNNPKAVEEFVTTMEASAQGQPYHRADDHRSGVCSDPDRIKSFMSKAFQNRVDRE